MTNEQFGGDILERIQSAKIDDFMQRRACQKQWLNLVICRCERGRFAKSPWVGLMLGPTHASISRMPHQAYSCTHYLAQVFRYICQPRPPNANSVSQWQKRIQQLSDDRESRYRGTQSLSNICRPIGGRLFREKTKPHERYRGGLLLGKYSCAGAMDGVLVWTGAASQYIIFSKRKMLWKCLLCSASIGASIAYRQ